MPTLYVRDASGFREAKPSDVLERAQALLSQRYRTGAPVLFSPSLTREFLRTRLGARDYETFGLIHLDVRYRLIAVEDLFRGTIDRASVHPRELVKAVLARNSAAVVLYHNHPLGGICCVNRARTTERTLNRVCERQISRRVRLPALRWRGPCMLLQRC